MCICTSSCVLRKYTSAFAGGIYAKDEEKARTNMTDQQFGRITRDPDILGGTPAFRGTRVPADTIAALAAGGQSTEEIIDLYPQLTAEDVEDAVAFQKESQDG